MFRQTLIMEVSTSLIYLPSISLITLYLFAGIVGIISVIIGLLFLLFSNHKSFAVTMLLIGILEIAVMFPSYYNYQTKIDAKVSFYENNINNFSELESISIKKELQSFFLLTLF